MTGTIASDLVSPTSSLFFRIVIMFVAKDELSLMIFQIQNRNYYLSDVRKCSRSYKLVERMLINITSHNN